MFPAHPGPRYIEIYVSMCIYCLKSEENEEKEKYLLQEKDKRTFVLLEELKIYIKRGNKKYLWSMKI